MIMKTIILLILGCHLLGCQDAERQNLRGQTPFSPQPTSSGLASAKDEDSTPLDSGTKDIFDNKEVIDRKAALDDFYLLTKVQKYEIEFNPGEYDQLRNQLPTQRCRKNKNDYSYFKVNVKINGIQLKDVGIRKKSYCGSQSQSKPSLKLHLKKYQEDLDYQGLTHLTLNNSRQDPSLVRQCLVYSFIKKTGYPAPRCNFASVTINGINGGIYVNIQPIKRPFLEEQFNHHQGKLFEGVRSDFTNSQINSFEQKSNLFAEDLKPSELIAPTINRDFPTLFSLLSEPDYRKFWAIEALTLHWDGYHRNRNNFYLYQNRLTGRYHFIPWGVDQTLQSPGSARNSGLATWNTSELGRAAFSNADLKKDLLDELQEVTNNFWQADDMIKEIDTMLETISAFILPQNLQRVTNSINSLKQIIRDRKATVNAEIAANR